MTQTGNSGIVHLVGAGPGDPGLLTLRGASLLAAAEVVVYDYLSNPALLGHAPAAEHVYVGKQASEHSMTQEQINALLVEKARQGKRVVRLKGGDPFVFGRGGEECEALVAAGIPFEVVSGITAAIAAPAYAGIPATHRDFNSSFTVVTGHEKEADYQDSDAQGRSAGSASDLDWSALAKLPCLAFYMGVKALPRICAKLIENGMPADTPAASIQWGTMSRQRTVVATVGDLPRKVEEAKLRPPAITIVGRVVSLQEQFNWFEKRPLFGQTIVVTRTRQQASELSGELAAMGAQVIEAPTIELHAPADRTEVDRALGAAGGYDWIVFTSANGVTFTKQRLMELGLDARALGRAKIAAVGDATASAIRQELCLKVDLCPSSFVAEALADELVKGNEVRGRKFLLLRADIARPVLRHRLEQDGAAEVRDVAVYETKPAAGLPQMLLDALDEKAVDWITFTSSSTAKNFMALLGEGAGKRLRGVRLASIGPITTATLKELGLRPTVQAEQYNIAGLVEAIVASKPGAGRRGKP